jgi:hypothetical protein
MKMRLWKKAVITFISVSLVFGGAMSVWAAPKNNAGPPGLQTAPGLQIAAKVKLSFEDTTEADVVWAQKHIAKLASKRVFEGYEDGTFQPRKPITRIEAITAAVRLLGLREEAESEEAMNTLLNFKDANKLEKQYSWAVGYVAIAVQNSLFFETDESVQPEKPADRLWATILLIKALELENEAEARMNVKLEFKDAKNIPAGSVGYVALAVELGLVKGYDNGTFRPNQPVTRAELAALLDRTDDQLLGNDTATLGEVKTITDDAIAIVRNDGEGVQLLTFAVDAQAFIYRDGQKVSLSAIMVGDKVLIRTYDGVAIFIEVTANASEEKSQFTVFGLLEAVTLNAQGQMSTISVTQAVYGGTQVSIYPVASEVEIIGDASLLVHNRLLELTGRNDKIIAIKIH